MIPESAACTVPSASTVPGLPPSARSARMLRMRSRAWSGSASAPRPSPAGSRSIRTSGRCRTTSAKSPSIDRLVSGLASFFVQKVVLCDRAEPGYFIRFATEVFLPGESPEEGLLRDLLCLRSISRQGHDIGEHPHVIGFVQVESLLFRIPINLHLPTIASSAIRLL